MKNAAAIDAEFTIAKIVSEHQHDIGSSHLRSRQRLGMFFLFRQR